MKLAISQIALGTLMTAVAVLTFLNGFPTMFSLSGNSIVSILWTSEIGMRHFIYAAVFFVLGLAVVGCGIMQLIRARVQKPAS